MRSRSVSGALLGLLLIGLFSVSKPTDRSGSSICQAVSAAPLSAYDNVTTHEGDLIIAGTQTYAIENATFVVNGNIIIKEEGKLAIESSRLVLNVSYWNEFTVSLYDNAVLDAKDSILDKGAQTQVLLQVFGETSTVRVLDTTCYLAINSLSHGDIIIESSEIDGQLFWHAPGCSRMSISDSDVQGELSLAFPGKFGGTVNATGLKTGHLTYVDMEVPGGGFLRISNSSVISWVISWEPISSFPDTHLIVENSTLEGVWLAFYRDSQVKIRGLKAPGFFAYWNLREEAELENVKHDLTLVNSSVGYFKLTTSGKAEFVNVSGVQVSTWANASALVENSTVNWCLNMRGMKDCAVLRNSMVTERAACFMDGRYAGKDGGDVHYVEFENTTINSSLYICTTYTYIKGKVAFLGGANYVWGTVEREYPVDIKDADENPLASASVGLFDDDGNSVWNGTTDQEGRILFNITFSSGNYQQEWTLTTKAHHVSFSNPINFLTSTPISFSMRSIQKEVEDSISYAEEVLRWARSLRTTQDLDKAQELLETARNEYSDGMYDEALRVVQEIIGLVGIKIDGSARDWEGIPPLITDPRGDALSEQGDLKSLYALMDHKFLYLLIQLYDEQLPTCFFFLMADTNLDGHGDYIIDAWGVNEPEPTRFRVVEGDNVVIMPHADYPIETAYGNGTVELKIPLEYLKTPTKIQAFVVTGDRTIPTIDQIRPVLISAITFTDLNDDGTVNILDISIVAKAYGCKLGDPKWNSTADLNKDGVINILDISLVAKDCGKTV